MSETSAFYGPGHRALQETFRSRDLADRLEAVSVVDALDDAAQAFIAARDFFFLSSVDTGGFPTVSYKGGDAGFVKVVSPTELLVPMYDGNGMFYSTGNIADDPKIGLLFINFEAPHRVRVKATAELTREPDVLALWPEVGLAARIHVVQAWINCPRYIHPMKKLEAAAHVPRENVQTPAAEWKSYPGIEDVVPPPPHEIKDNSTS